MHTIENAYSGPNNTHAEDNINKSDAEIDLEKSLHAVFFNLTYIPNFNKEIFNHAATDRRKREYIAASPHRKALSIVAVQIF